MLSECRACSRFGVVGGGAAFARIVVSPSRRKALDLADFFCRRGWSAAPSRGGGAGGGSYLGNKPLPLRNSRTSWPRAGLYAVGFFFACWMKPAMASRLLEKKKKICQVAKAAGEKARPATAIARTQSLTGGRLRRSIWLGMRNLSISMVQWHVGGSCLATGPRSGSAASAADCVLVSNLAIPAAVVGRFFTAVCAARQRAIHANCVDHERRDCRVLRDDSEFGK